MKRLIAVSIILLLSGCNSHPNFRCFGASTPTELYLNNTSGNEICAIIQAELFNGKIIQDKVCIKNNEVRSLCYELENIPTHEIIVKIDSFERTIKLSSRESNELNFAEIKE
ncbi:hypothetical protein [Algoriphagus aquimarinus]|uniref:Uncharacterized protein n=1 Tax=Algoriphagus aquimarinus TaxID=237018 RepID=A0A1I0VSH7_9BACT|nr:hypothetical protein [Algoriphagus aquimarinus]SFA79304.1 hypothetical protein SAMN04489723_101352 [Algoriphagus aquimarinus]